jgi:hypothetical protein
MAAISNDMQAFLTGHLMGQVTIEAAKYRAGEGVMKITDVQPDRDEEGNYMSTFNVTFESGLVLSVSVNEVTEIPESA